MTDQEIIECSLGALGAPGEECEDLYLVKKGGRVLLALPREKEAALMALRLYQPQRFIAKVFAQAITLAVRLGIQSFFFKRVVREDGGQEPEKDAGEGLQGSRGSAGILLGNPDHLVRRAIVSFRAQNGFEVAKIAFGKEGVKLIEREVQTITGLPKGRSGIPEILGTHHREEIGVMRMPYLNGGIFKTNDPEIYINLLSDWLLDEARCPLGSFAEWEKIESVLSALLQREDDVSARVNFCARLERLKDLSVKPSIRHGDFAPWNLIQDQTGRVLALDWEWGVPRGVSGFDVIHFLTQEMKLVQRLTPEEIRSAVDAKLQTEPFAGYLEAAGWAGSLDDLFLAAVAFGASSGLDGSEELLRISSLANLARAKAIS